MTSPLTVTFSTLAGVMGVLRDAGGHTDDQRSIDSNARENQFMNKLLDTIRDKTGVYATGFNPASTAGIVLPVLFVIVVGGGLAAWIILR